MYGLRRRNKMDKIIKNYSRNSSEEPLLNEKTLEGMLEKRRRFGGLKQGKTSDMFQENVHTSSSSEASECCSSIELQEIDLNKNNNDENVIGGKGVVDDASSDQNAEELLSLCMHIADANDSDDCDIDLGIVRESIFPVVKHKLDWSIDASVNDISEDSTVSSLVSRKSETEDNVSRMSADTCKDHGHRPLKGTTKGVRFVGSLRSNRSSESGDLSDDVADAAMNRNGSSEQLITMETFGNEVLGDNCRFGSNARTDVHRGSETTRKKHNNVLNEIKSQAKATKREQNEVERIQKSRFGDVLLELKSHSLELDEETKWIHRHIKRRECSHFIAVQNRDTEESVQDSTKCQCDYTYKQHNTGARRNEIKAAKWEYKKHSIQKTTNAFGDIEFAGYGGNIGKYIRVDIDTKMSDMLELMMNVWGLDKPNLLISVTGGAKNFQMNKRLKETFRRGLMKTALSTGAWIVTGGTHAGVMKHVGEAVKDFGIASTSKNPVISIGIAPWGCIQNKQVLVDDQCQGMWPANYRIEKEQRSKESFLDPNHTHFILVDNATQHKFAVEIPFRARLENKIAKMRTDTGDNAVSVPIVLLVLEGGPGTLETVYQAMQNNTPSVIVKGSGRAADILAHAYQNAKEEEIEANDHEGKKQMRARRFMDDSLMLEVRDMVEKEFKTDVDTHMSRIRDCLDKCDYMSVFELDIKSGVKEIDVAMLQALLKANKNQVMDQLRLALAWNRIDVAKSNIFTDDKRWPTGSLDDVMFSALQLNRVDFIELFLDHGVSLREFLTKKRLLLLYNKIPPNCLLRTMLSRVKAKEDRHRKNFSLLDVGLLMQVLMGDSFCPIYTTKDEYAMLDVDHILDGLMLKQAREGAISGIKTITQFAMDPATACDEADAAKNTKHQLPDFENPSQELFIWSVLMIRQSMSKLFWAEGKDAIAAALVGNSLLRAMRGKTEDTELVLAIKHNMDEWSDLAVGVLSECHTTDEHKAQDLLIRELSNWGDTTCMLIAVKADNKDFISQTACQSLLNSIWMGKLTQDNKTWRLLSCTLCPPLALVLLNFVPIHDEKSNKTPQEYDLDNKQDDPGKSKIMRRQTTMFMKEKQLSVNTQGSKASMQAVEDKETTELGANVKRNMHSMKDKIFYFFNAPVVIFLNNVLSYLVFLGLFTYVLIFNFNPNVSTAEIILMIWVFTIFSEEIRQIATTTSSSLADKLQSYMTDTWNIVDMITIGLFTIGMILRFLPHSNTFEAARVFLALNFVSFFLRLLHIFSVHKELGPKLVMIGRMVQDLMYFLVILMVFVVSYAIASHSILFPNSPLRWSTAIDVIRKSYWNIYGELFLEEIEGSSDCTFDEMLWINGTFPRCPTATGRVVVPIMMGVYMLLANVLLLNLLIAMFSYTFTLVQDNTDKHWFFQRYTLIYEYYTRPVLSPPLIFFSHIYLLVKFIFTSCCCRKSTSNSSENGDDFRRKFKNERELVQWENVIADAFHQKTELKEFESMEYRVNNTNTLIKDLTCRIDELQEQQQALFAADHVVPIAPVMSPSNVVVQLPAQLDNRLDALERNMEKTHDSLKWIMKVLQEGKVDSNVSVPPTISNWEEQRLEEQRQFQFRAGEERAKVREMLQRGINSHFRSRTSPYLGSDVARFPVPDDKVTWNTHYPEYSPSVYTAPAVLQDQTWADEDIFNMTPHERANAITSFNAVDSTKHVNRMSFIEDYVIKDGLPLNPKGRTGLQGRGLLGRWGPNQAGDPVVTRWKKTEDGAMVMKEGKPVLEFVAVLRSDNQMWALPGAMLPPGCKPADHLEADFTEEAVGDLHGAKDEKIIKKKLKKLWKKGVKIYEGYADDPRNTDNAWIETTAFSYHDNEGTILNKFHLKAGGSAELVSWLNVSHKVTMHGSHLYLLKLAADRLGAYF